MMVLPIARPLAQAVMRAVTEPWVAAFSPLSLFAAGEQGVWYDPSDMSTLFQDSAGTTPVTATGQPVGLLLDKSKGLRGAELISNGSFDNGSTGWTLEAGWSVAGGKLVASNAASGAYARTAITITAGKIYEVIYECVAYTSGQFGFTLQGGGSLTRSGTGVFREIIAAGATTNIGMRSNGSLVAEFDNISVRELPGNHATQSTAAARPTFRDVGGLRYLEFDGVDDSLVTGSINFTATDKLSVFAGARKTSDAATAMLAELSVSAGATWPGSMYVVGASPTNIYQFRMGGTSFSTLNTAAYPAPHSAVITCTGDIAADATVGRINGAQLVSGADLGTGNFGSHALYIGRRGGTSLPFVGHLYGLIVRGALTDAAGISNSERYLAIKSGVTLP